MALYYPNWLDEIYVRLIFGYCILNHVDERDIDVC